ncbi:Metallo-dependent phosphatase [Zopfia rhizophila CBS 207.26]|uniref:Metallo-dependent phosphatase n=1 Tax=Zopfia rhizophila CBS 207.26 TaxID=1314779 RepID=A0A6A6EB23_9PEZI|nr:Metallo-dependent phosphatase [Zopfia rhizophila CBS 207.26]
MAHNHEAPYYAASAPANPLTSLPDNSKTPSSLPPSTPPSSSFSLTRHQSNLAQQNQTTNTRGGVAATTRLRSSTKPGQSPDSTTFTDAANPNSRHRDTRAFQQSMSFPGDIKTPHRPLIDLIPNDNLYVSDEDEAFYAKEEDHFIHPHWKAMIHRTSNRVPRRVQRYFVIYFVLLVITWVAWKSYLGPRWEHDRQELREMEETPSAVFGSNVRPAFKDLVQVKSMDEKHLPGKHGKRLVIVGDVHGCKEELEALLKKVDFNQENDHLILTGDMVAKGPDSPGVIDLAQKYSASCVRGNHEDRLLLSVAETRSHHQPLPGPEESTDRSSDFLGEESFSHGDYKIRKLAEQFSDSQIEYMQQCPVILKVGQVEGMGEVLVVHAGLVPGVPLERQDPFQCMNMRTIDLKTRLPSADRDGTPWEKFWNHQQNKLEAKDRSTVVYGHDSKRGKNILEYSKGLDSGCVNGGKLTAMVVEKGKSRLGSEVGEFEKGIKASEEFPDVVPATQSACMADTGVVNAG